MKPRPRAFVLAFAVAGCAVLRPSPAPRASAFSHGARPALARVIDSMITAPEFRTTNWGILIVDPVAAETLYAHNAAKLFIPASNQKLVVSSVALEQLGPDYRYRTVFAAPGGITEQTISNLVIAGRGDPTASDHMKGDAMRPLRDVADSLWQRGVRRVVGNVVELGNAFPGPVAGAGWPWDQLDATSFAGVDELLFNEGLITVRVRPGARPGDPGVIETAPARTFPGIRNAVVTGARDTNASGGGRGGRAGGRGGTRVAVAHDTGTTNVVVSGRIAVGDSASVTFAQHDPNTAYTAALTEALRDRGIVVEQRPTPSSDERQPDSLFTIQSVPLREILPALMKPSQNQIAEALLRTLGLERTGVGTADSGRRVVERQFATWGIPSDAFVVRDGSGLSRSDLISPEAIIKVLDVMRRSPNFDVYYASLPIAGVDGTIRTRMRGTAAENNVRAKTGTLSMVRSLSGYVTSADGRLLTFSILCNNWTAPQASVDRVADAIAAQLATARGKG